MIVKDDILRELSFSASRSGGKGGQNVNKVSTKVELRFDVLNTNCLNEDELALVSLKLKNRISNEGILILTCETERTQLANKKKVIELFFELVERALIKPKKRIKTRPSRASKERRLKEKKIRSERKNQRRIE